MSMLKAVKSTKLDKEIQTIEEDFEQQLQAIETWGEERLEKPVELETGYDTCIVVDNVPKVDQQRCAKLVEVLTKIFGHVGSMAEDGLYLPIDPATGQTPGFAFVEYESAEHAAKAVKSLNGLKLDRKHTFQVSPYSALLEAEETPDDYEEPEIEVEEKPKLQQWLLDPRGINQFAIRYQDVTEVCWNTIDYEVTWNDPRQRLPQTYWKKEGLPVMFAAWSPLGSYLATVHGPGVALWGGPAPLQRLHKLSHPGVKLLDFSPGEKYLVTMSSKGNKPGGREPKRVTFHAIETGRLLHVFEGLKTNVWPLFRWNHTDKYFAALGKNKMQVYDASTMTLLNKKPLKIPGVTSFEWSPKADIVAFYVTEEANRPAAVTLLEIPARTIRAQQALFSVKDCHLHWHPSGNYLAAKIDRWTKSKKKFFTVFELFRVNEKNVPVESLEFTTDDPVHAFAWQPSGKRFAIIHGSPTSATVSFYQMSGKQVKKVKDLEQKNANALFWSPTNDFLVLASIKPQGASFEFINTRMMETMGTGDHLNATDYSWDPSGRFFVSSCSAWRHSMETGYLVWSFTGKLLAKNFSEKFFELLWRPRPPTLLSKEDEKDVRRNMGKISEEMAKEDALLKRYQKREFYLGRQKQRKEFYAKLEEARAAREAEKERLDALYAHYAEEEFVTVEEVVEEVLEEDVVPLY